MKLTMKKIFALFLMVLMTSLSFSQNIEKTVCPVIAINGSKDSQVLSSLNLPAIKKELPENHKDLIKEYPGMNHLFQVCTTGLPDEYVKIENTISVEVLEDMVHWINQL